ncbi:MAG: serine/threonine protein kinase [Fibrobacter sp.]|nr:serine/threonine protein kinase [Fibrobacter sp.]
MPHKNNVHSESIDEFAGISGFKAHSDIKTNALTNREDGSIRNDAYGYHNPEIGTKVYIGKKITEVHEIKSKSHYTDTTLKGVSIDTDFKQVLHKENKPEDSFFSNTSIETDEFTIARKSHNQVKVEEETGDIQSANSTPSNYIRKEKQATQNLSVDISSDFRIRQLPSGKEPLQLGSGIISGLLGSGGMAKVYKIWNEKLEVFRAVKLLSPSHDKESWNRFLTEAKISAKLNHPNIVEIYSIGEWQGLPYMEMELIEGETLSSILFRYKSLPSFLCSAIAVLVSRALAYAHVQQILIYGKKYTGIIHRDLKPSNVMIGKSGAVKLMDFGVARPIETGFHTVNTDSIVGTMHYFSPEQINGYPVDPLSDIYSFGAVLYEMICGANPFPYKRMGDLVQAKLKNSYKRLENFDAHFHPALASAAQVCLRTDKNARFTSSVVLRDHLEKIHKTFNIGSPEEVIKNFFRNPQKMYEEALQRRFFQGQNSNEDFVKMMKEKKHDNNSGETAKLSDQLINDIESGKPDDIFITNRNRKRKNLLLAVFAIVITVIGVLMMIRHSHFFSYQDLYKHLDDYNYNKSELKTMDSRGTSQ